MTEEVQFHCCRRWFLLPSIRGLVLFFEINNITLDCKRQLRCSGMEDFSQLLLTSLPIPVEAFFLQLGIIYICNTSLNVTIISTSVAPQIWIYLSK